MRVITESDGVRVEAHETGWFRVNAGDDEFAISPDIPTEALLAIVADRLREDERYHRHDRIGEKIYAAELSVVEAMDLLSEARSPDTKQEEGR